MKIENMIRNRFNILSPIAMKLQIQDIATTATNSSRLCATKKGTALIIPTEKKYNCVVFFFASSYLPLRNAGLLES